MTPAAYARKTCCSPSIGSNFEPIEALLRLNRCSERAHRSDAIFQVRLSSAARAMDAAVNFTSLLDAMSDDPAMAMRANWCQRVDRALEAVKGMVRAGHDYLKRLVIFIFANFACSHT